LVPRSAGKSERTGQTLYHENCSGCHRPDRKGTPPEFPSLINIDKKRTPEQISAVVEKGAGRMPGFAHLGDEAVNAIVQFIRTGEDMHLSGAEHKQSPRS